MNLRPVLRNEFARRRRINASYSMRAFARSLQVHHSILSRLLNSEGGVPARTVRRLAVRLGLSADLVSLICRGEGEARVAQAIARCGPRPDSRRIATLAGVPVDAVNVALQSLLARGALRMHRGSHWQLT